MQLSTATAQKERGVIKQFLTVLTVRSALPQLEQRCISPQGAVFALQTRNRCRQTILLLLLLLPSAKDFHCSMLGLACRSSSRHLLQDVMLLPLSSFLEAGVPLLAQQQPTPSSQASAQHSSYGTHAPHSSSRKRTSKGHVPRLPSSIDWEQPGVLQPPQQQASLLPQQLPQIPEGELMALIGAASSISDIERLVLQFHSQFK